MSEPKIRVKRTLTFTEEVPHNEDYYPNMTLQEAEEYENKMEFPEVMELLEQIDSNKVTIQTDVTVVREGVSWNDVKEMTWEDMK